MNKLNAYQEMSDYQVAAFLLHLPSQIISEKIYYSEPYGAINFKQQLLQKKDNDNNLTHSLLEQSLACFTSVCTQDLVNQHSHRLIKHRSYDGVPIGMQLVIRLDDFTGLVDTISAER